MRTIGFLLYDGAQALDISGPMDVLAAANDRRGKHAMAYAFSVIGLDGLPARTESGLRMLADTTLEQAPALDTLIIPGGIGSRLINRDARLLDWIRQRAATTRRVVSVCTGIYLLAASGLLDGRRVTTHWQHAAHVRRCFPALRMEADQLFLRDGKFATSGGLTAGMDLALALVEEDLGQRAALDVARILVMYMKRPGNQAQYSAPLSAQTDAGGRLEPLIDWILEHLDQRLDIDRLADQVAMSPRNFRRLFVETFEATPAAFIEGLRLQRSCELLASGTMPLDRIATAVGFRSTDVFRRAFRKRFLSTPTEYRQRFGP